MALEEIWKYEGGVAKEPCFLLENGPKYPDHDRQKTELLPRT